MVVVLERDAATKVVVVLGLGFELSVEVDCVKLCRGVGIFMVRKYAPVSEGSQRFYAELSSM